MKGAAAMSVEMCAVTEISSAEGTAASTIQRAASRQVGAGTRHVFRRRLRCRACVRSISTPHHAISAISATNSTAQAQRCWPSVVNGSTTNG